MNTTINITVGKEEDGLRFKIKHEGDVLDHDASVQAKYALHDYWYAINTCEQAKESQSLTHEERMTMQYAVKFAGIMIEKYHGKGKLVDKEIVRMTEEYIAKGLR